MQDLEPLSSARSGDATLLRFRVRKQSERSHEGPGACHVRAPPLLPTCITMHRRSPAEMPDLPQSARVDDMRHSAAGGDSDDRVCLM